MKLAGIFNEPIDFDNQTANSNGFQLIKKTGERGLIKVLQREIAGQDDQALLAPFSISGASRILIGNLDVHFLRGDNHAGRLEARDFSRSPISMVEVNICIPLSLMDKLYTNPYPNLLMTEGVDFAKLLLIFTFQLRG